MLLVAFSNGCQLTVNEFVELPICHGLALSSCFSNIT